MDLNRIGLVALMQGKMNWLTRNHDVLAQNIANADTPGYKAHELAPFDFRTMVKSAGPRVAVATTEPGHLAGLRGSGGGGARVKRDTYDVSMTGNTVSLDEQSVAIAENALEYQLATSLYGKAVGLLRAAIGNNR